MVSTRFLGLVSTVLLVVGALAFGEALHRTVVTNQAPLTSPLMVVYFVLGAACIVAGYRVRQPVGRRYALGSDDERDGTDRPRAESGSGSESGLGSGPGSTAGSGADRSADGEFDPQMSPLGDAAPGDARAPDDGEDATDREADGERSRNRGAEGREGRNGDDGA